MNASELIDTLTSPNGSTFQRKYWDKQNFSSYDEFQKALEASTTCYVGNLAFSTPEQLIYEFASQIGPVKTIIMGLNRTDGSPCGFAFVEYFTKDSCVNACRLLTGQRFDNRVVKFEADTAFIEGRQYGRGKSGNQVRDDFREDAARGGRGELISTGKLVLRREPPRAASSYPVPYKPINSRSGANRRNRSPSEVSRQATRRNSILSAPKPRIKVDQFGRDIIDDEHVQD